ncbi:S41 family peptidase [Catenovulum sp. SX2]|uniref:S41 family peptidase n=1 Tax=Catenovulum sp. SX2 TaxID=3398614 RepID=UPI003F832923
MRKAKCLSIGLACSIFLTACGGSDDGGQCSKQDIHSHWYQTLEQDYLWYDELSSPSTSFNLYEDSNQLLNDVLPSKDRFSVVLNSDDWQDSIAGNNFGYGIELAAAPGSRIVVVQSFNNSAAANAGITRGDQLVSIGEVAASKLYEYLYYGNYTAYSEAFGPDQNGYELEFVWRDSNGAEKSATLAKSQYQVNTVTEVEIIDSNAGKIAYLGFQNGFLEPSPAELKQAFSYLKSQDFDHFVLDLRNNTGGLVSVAAELALYLAGDTIYNQIFLEFEFNPNNSEYGGVARTEELIYTELNGSVTSHINYIRQNSLNLDNLTILTNDYSASASEVLINSLDPYITVHTIGESTYGKPVGFLPDDYCDETLLAVNFQTNNAVGFGDYLNGLAPDCAVSESSNIYPWTSMQDPVFAKAVSYINSGYSSCSSSLARPLNEEALIIPPNNKPQGMWLEKK